MDVSKIFSEDISKLNSNKNSMKLELFTSIA